MNPKRLSEFVCPCNGADSDDLARVYRFDLAQDSEMISPTLPIRCRPGARGVLAVWFLASAKPRGQS